MRGSERVFRCRAARSHRAATHHAVEATKRHKSYSSSSRCLAFTPVVQSFDLEIAQASLLHWPPARPVWRGRDRSPSAPYRRSSVAPRRSPGPLRRPQRAASRLCRGYRGNWPARFDAFGVLAVGFGLGVEGRTFIVLDAKSGKRSTARQNISNQEGDSERCERSLAR